MLDVYLGGVGMYLPKGSDRRDILAELRGHLESNMDERSAALGRPLTESEQEDVLADYGDPFTVAARYRERVGRGLAIGPLLLLSPGALRVCLGVLLFALAANLIIGAAEILMTGASVVPLVRRLVVAMLALSVALIVSFAGVDFFLRRSAKRQRGAPESWLFWTPYLKYVPRWYSASGLVFMGAVALVWGLWWSAWPAVPALVLGPAVEPLERSLSWQLHQRLLLGLLALGVAQRAITLARPDLNWLPCVARFAINVLCVAMLYPILNDASFVVVPDGVAASAETVEIARTIDARTRGLIRGFGGYWVLNTVWIALVCAGHVAYRVQHWRQRAQPHAASSSRG